MPTIKGIKDIAMHYKVADVTVARWMKHDDFPTRKIDRAHTIKTDEVDAWLTSKGLTPPGLEPTAVRMDGRKYTVPGTQEHEDAAASVSDKVRKLKLEADKLELDLEIKRGLYVERSVVAALLQRSLKEIKTIMVEAVEDIKGTVPAMSGEKSLEIDRKIDEAFNRAFDVEL